MNRLVISLLVALVVLSGCGKKHGTEDLRAFTANAHKDKKPEVDPLPALQPAAVFIYTASSETDPFNKRNLRTQQAENEDIGGGENAPDLTRKKEPLEAFPIDALELVGIMNLDGIDWAIVEAPDKTVHRATEGHYMGKNHGQIVRVLAREVRVEQLIRNPVGKWEKQPAKLVLAR